MSLVLKIPRRLESPNKSRGAHWRVRHRIAKDWAWAIWACSNGSSAMKRSHVVRGQRRDEPDIIRYDDIDYRVRVTIERHVPSRRNFIKDADNLAFCVKPVLDSLKRLGYIKDDSRKWLDHPTPTQHVSEDGKDWTVIRIEAAT